MLLSTSTLKTNDVPYNTVHYDIRSVPKCIAMDSTTVQYVDLCVLVCWSALALLPGGAMYTLPL